ncbi:unnamed protein product [Orchesella dallaii]|uniref:Gustatory receptor n=1 Tax=Orchesella dallaii TaxID=48710 RepID=A0ABP1RVS3_9HEXA
MLLKRDFLVGLKAHLKTQLLFGTTPIIFRENKSLHDHEEGFLCHSSNNTIPKQWFKLLFSTIFVTVWWFQIVQSIKEENLVTILESMLYAVALSTFILMKRAYLQKRRFVVELLNMVLRFEFTHFETNSSEINQNQGYKYFIFFCQLSGILGTPILILAYSLQRWFNPCTSATFAYRLFLPECSAINPLQISWKFSSLLALFLTILLSIWVIIDLCGCLMFQTFELAFVQCCCLKEYLKWLHGVMKSSALGQFDLSLVSVYRELQLLSRLYNWIQQDVIIIALTNMTVFVFIVSLYALILMGSHASVPHILFFSSVVLLGLLVIVVCFGTFAGLHTQSTKLIVFLRKKVNLSVWKPHKKRLIERYSWSLREIKVSIGQVNFVDKLTPVIMLNFCISQIVSLLLIE